MTFLYELPHGLMALLIVGACVSAALAAQPLLHRLWPPGIPDNRLNNAVTFTQMLVAVAALLTAFCAVTVWTSFGNAGRAASDEANEASQLSWDLSVYATPEALRTRAALEGYLNAVIEKEWPLLARHEESEEAAERLHEVFRAASRIEASTGRETVLLGEIWARANGIAKCRRSRLHAAGSGVPGTLWAVLGLCAVLIFCGASILPPTRVTRTLIGLLATSLGLVLFFIVAMDHPFSGKESVGPRAFRSALDHMKHWDETAAPSRAATP